MRISTLYSTFGHVWLHRTKLSDFLLCGPLTPPRSKKCRQLRTVEPKVVESDVGRELLTIRFGHAGLLSASLTGVLAALRCTLTGPLTSARPSGMPSGLPGRLSDTRKPSVAALLAPGSIRSMPVELPRHHSCWLRGGLPTYLAVLKTRRSMLAESTVRPGPHAAVISRRRTAGQYIYI